jgi:hypothetical protein
MADLVKFDDTATHPVAKRKTGLDTLRRQRMLCRDFYDGQDVVQSKTTTYLPLLQGEQNTPTEYQARLLRSMLDNRVEEAVEFAVSQIVKDEIQLEEDVPLEIRGQPRTDTQAEQLGWDENIDLRGKDLTRFASDVFRDYWIEGVGGFLVTMPGVRDAAGNRVAQPTKAQFEQSGARPYWVRYAPDDVLYWDYEFVQGRRRLRHLRLRDTATVKPDEFSSEAQERILCFWSPMVGQQFCTYQVWIKVENRDKRETWIPSEETPQPVPMEKMTEIPFVVMGELDGPPPLLALAHMNLFHYQRLSDKDNWEHFACVPVPGAFGVSEDQFKNGIKWSASEMILFTNPQARMETIILHDEGVRLMKESLKDLEEKIAQRAMRSILETDPGGVTATASAMAGARAVSRLQSAWLAFVDVLELGLQYTAIIAGLGPDGGSVCQKREFFALPKDAQILAFIQWMKAEKLLSGVGTFSEAQRYGFISGSLDYKEEQTKIEEETPKLGMSGTSSALAMRAMMLAGVDPEAAEVALAQAETELSGPEEPAPMMGPREAAGGVQ